jgi:phosphoglycolate phosphatase
MKLLIFDFDGTLADTKKIWIESIMRVLKEEKFSCPKCITDIIVPFGRKIQDVLELLDVPKEKIDEIRCKIHRLVMKRKVKTADLKPLKEIKARKIILSNSPKFIVNHLLKDKVKIFDKVYGSEDFSDKAKFIMELLKKYKLNKKEVWYIGDISQDVRVARKAGCRSVIISHKFSWNSLKEIMKEEPDILIRSFKDLKKLA